VVDAGDMSAGTDMFFLYQHQTARLQLRGRTVRDPKSNCDVRKWKHWVRRQPRRRTCSASPRLASQSGGTRNGAV